jgi:long-chain acyl-CoA synthetase
MHAHLDPSDLFSESKFFFDLLLKCSAQSNQVFARTYVNGSWLQFSGRDFISHVSRAINYWLEFFPDHLTSQPNHKTQNSIIFLTRNTYNSFVSSVAAILCGFDVMFAPTQMNKKDLGWCLDYFKGVAIATDMDELGQHLDGFSVPVIQIASAAWVAEDVCEEPEMIKVYREKKCGQVSLLPPKKEYETLRPGHLAFVSFGHDGFQKPEILTLDAMVITAQNFLIHAEIPKEIFWKSLEMMAPSNPFAHMSKLCVLLKNGIMGFPNLSGDWETNLRILRPTFLFNSSSELSQVCHFIEAVLNRKHTNFRLNASAKLDKLNQFLMSPKIGLSETRYDFLKNALLKTARTIAGPVLLKETVEDLRFIVHGLSSAHEGHVALLENMGVPVLETYGTTQACGILSSNTFHSPHLNTIGTPLPHVNFRLGRQSILEYRISLSLFRNHSQWEETGDVAQMTPYGFIITGRKRHLFVTLGGVIVSPARLEQLLKDDGKIQDACVIGDKLPYLSALIILHHDAMSDYRQNPAQIREHVQVLIANLNETLPRNVTIKKFAILDRPFTEANGERLSNGELNRLKVQETCAEVIASLY